jgi:low temperature requirement protein LtrA
VPRAFDLADFGVITIGYVVMRLAMVSQWLRAAHADGDRRPTALRYALGITLVQIGWVLRLGLGSQWFLGSFLLLATAEMLVPVWAELANPTTWHPQHISERYGLFTLIVLGETVLAASLAVQSAFGVGHNGGLLGLALASVIIVFSMWWIYFDRPAHELLRMLRIALKWGYGHYLIFAAAAAVGAGVAAAVDFEIGRAHLSETTVAYAVALPVSIYVFSVWALHIRPHLHGAVVWAYPATALVILMMPLSKLSIYLVAVLMACLVTITTIADMQIEHRPRRRQPRRWRSRRI